MATGRRYVGLDPIGDDAKTAFPSPTGRRIYVTFTDGRVRAVDPADGRFVGPVLRVDGDPTSVVSSSPDDLLVAVAHVSGPSFGTVVFDAVTGAVVARSASGGMISGASAGRADYAATLTGTITRYGMPGMTELGSLPGSRGEINSLQLSVDGSLLAGHCANALDGDPV